MGGVCEGGAGRAGEERDEVVSGVGWREVVCCLFFVGVCVLVVCWCVCGLPMLFLISPKKNECPPGCAGVRP